ncbi:L,D-transpeptidase family protein [Bacillus sp. 1NLA3E]|uniref:L,D-transpeptidase family protein n=1 Tax=Bacillus sp. 1NLA3E TaxID=666686 RepID=UPI000247F1B3|nr:toxin Cry1Ac domain D-VI-related protein [Bacillus sp. 1NLA3E]
MGKRKTIMFSMIIIFILIGMGFSYVHHIQKVKAAEQKKTEEYNDQLIKSAKEMVGNLYANDKKEALATDISDEKIKKALNKVGQVKDVSLKKTLVKEINNVAFLLKVQTDLASLLIDGVLIEGADEEKIAALSKNVDKVKPINPKIYNTFNSVLEEISTQFNTIKTAKEKLSALFTDLETSTVKDDITRDMFNDAKSSIDSIKNKKVKESFASLIAKVDSSLTSKEKQEKLKQEQQNALNTQNQAKTSSPQSQVATSNVQSPTDLASFVAGSKTASKTNQIVTVVANGSSAKISLFEKNDAIWNEVINTNGYVGSLGVGQAKEGSSKTPKGSYSLGFAFGTSNPGTKLPFKQITRNSYWISNVNDSNYNTWQERETSSSSDEHLADYPVQYQYAIVINYNNGVGGGSAFFLHVGNGRPTAGCVSVPREVMVQFMQRIAPGAYIINVNSQSEIAYY